MSSLRLHPVLFVTALAGATACKADPAEDCADTLTCNETATLAEGGARAVGAPDAAGASAAGTRSAGSTGGTDAPHEPDGGAPSGGQAGASTGGLSDPAGGGGAAGASAAGSRSAGTHTAGASAAGASEAGSSAAGANSPTTTPPYGSCNAEAALGCAGPAGVEALLCHDGVWTLRQTCAPTERCDGPSGTCQPIVPGCAELEPGDSFCSAGQVLTTCGPDLVTAEDTLCEGLCDESVPACTERACGDGLLQDDEQCDDGNGDAGDGCSPACRHEAVGLALGSRHSCALGANGAVKCWGSNFYGQLGLGDTENHGDEPGEMGDALAAVDLGEGQRAQAIGAGSGHTCALLEDGAVKCWGGNSCGQLGLGNTEHRGDDPGEMGDALAAVDLGAGRRATQLAAGEVNTCALLNVGTIVCWGSNSDSQCRPSSSGSDAVGDAADEMGNSLYRIVPPEPVQSIAVGDEYVCALAATGAVYCWGQNSSGQLGLGVRGDYGNEVDELTEGLQAIDLGAARTAVRIVTNRDANSQFGGYFTCAIRDDGMVRCWGYLGTLLLGTGSFVGDGPNEMGDALPAFALPAGRRAVALGAGTRHLCVLEDDGSVRCWSDKGTLSGGSDMIVAGVVPDALPLGTGRRAKALAAGSNHTCVLLDEGSVKCWGTNGSGELGLGDVIERGGVVAELGDALPAVALTF